MKQAVHRVARLGQISPAQSRVARLGRGNLVQSGNPGGAGLQVEQAVQAYLPLGSGDVSPLGHSMLQISGKIPNLQPRTRSLFPGLFQPSSRLQARALTHSLTHTHARTRTREHHLLAALR